MKEYRLIYQLRNIIGPRGHNLGFGVEVAGLVFNVEIKIIIAKIKQGDKFYVEAAGHKAYAEVAVQKVTGREYIRTVPDDTPLDNISNLPARTCSWNGPDDPQAWGWGNPTEPVDLPFSWTWRWLSRSGNDGLPQLDTHGFAPDCENRMPVGFSNRYDNDTLSVLWRNTLYRGFIDINTKALAAKKIKKAEISLKITRSIYQIGEDANNFYSSLRSVWRPFGPWTEFIDPTLMSLMIINDVPATGGVGQLSSYDVGAQLIKLDITSTIEGWRVSPASNYGLMLVGWTEAELHNNDTFYSCYDVLSAIAEQEMDIPW